MGATARLALLAFATRPMNDSSTGSSTTHATFYMIIPFYNHGLIDTTRCGYERMTELPDRTSELKNKNLVDENVIQKRSCSTAARFSKNLRKNLGKT